ncbi:hypothetical protein BC826DRAFT_1113584 [Russula brevipes]|nr:hypothetical protein BC826DRAFT_1113584 [Russula brevipes]
MGLEEIVSPEDEQRRREEEEDEKLVREVFSKVSVPVAGPSHQPGDDGEPAAPASTLVTVKRKADDVEPDIKSLLPEGTRVMVNAMSASLQPAKKKKADSSRSLGIKLVKKKEKAVVAS